MDHSAHPGHIRSNVGDLAVQLFDLAGVLSNLGDLAFQLLDLDDELVHFGFVFQDLMQALEDVTVVVTKLTKPRLEVGFELFTQPCLEVFEGSL